MVPRVPLTFRILTLAGLVWLIFGVVAFSGSGVALGQDEPVIDSISIEPASPVTGDELKAVAEVDVPVGAEELDLVYLWKINGAAVQEGESEALKESVKRADVVAVEVRSVDGRGGTASSVVLVGNAAPSIQVADQKIDSDGNFEARIEGTDPEEDKITYELRKSPPGMSIDPSSGTLRWAAGQQEGSFAIEVIARDEQGAETSLSYQVMIKRETEGGKSAQ